MDASLSLYHVEFDVSHEADVDTDPHETYWRDFWAENEEHALEQARDAIPDEEIIDVWRD